VLLRKAIPLERPLLAGAAIRGPHRFDGKFMSLVFYDTETTGIHTAFDQILQFAAIQTDDDFNELDRFEIRCRLLPHVVPSPGAMRVTGVSVAQLTDPNLPSHYEMVRAIRRKLDAWSPAVFMGYNSLQFDEQLLRQALFQTLHSPYLTNTNGNCRADVLRIVQAASVFAPNTITVPVGDRGQSVFRLDRLAPANGFDHAHAHDALADVEATIHLCRLLAERNHEFWSWCTRFSRKFVVQDFVRKNPVFCLTEFYYSRPHSWLVTPIGKSPGNQNDIFALDLANDPDELGALDDDELARRLAQSPRPVRRIRANAFPLIAPVDDMPAASMASELSRAEVERRAAIIRRKSALRERLCALMDEERKDAEPSPHLEEQIYDGFITDEDAPLLAEFHDASWDDRLALTDRIRDRRLRLLGRRLVYFERPDLFARKERRDIEIALAKRLLGTDDPGKWLTLPDAIRQADDLIATATGDERKLLDEHRAYLAGRTEQASRLTG
jgi:exodeoxyribonuclease-1